MVMGKSVCCLFVRPQKTNIIVIVQSCKTSVSAWCEPVDRSAGMRMTGFWLWKSEASFEASVMAIE